MVQRKITINKADNIKLNNKPFPSIQNPSSLQQNHDVKKKKMKKSGKTNKHSDFENLLSPELRRKITPPPEKLRSSSSSTPNYMKSTSSSDARKENPKSLVSSRSPQSVSSKCKSSNTSKLGQNPARNLARDKSLNLVRALTKSPSFKPARGKIPISSKKCSQVEIICENFDAQRATCSSKLKDSKFPCYLELSHGGTESQGTSAMKVCPFTYCSLNGHRHLPLPPLKSFLSARRRAVKAQRSLKIGCLSPRRSRPSVLSSAAGDEDQQEENLDFVIEIYCKEMEDIVQNHDLEPAHCSSDGDLSAEDGEGDHPASVAPEESESECLSEEHSFETESINQSDSEDSNVDCEGLEGSAFYIDAGVNHNEETDLEVYGSDKKACYDDIQDESDKNGCGIDEILAKDALQESFDEESTTSGAWSSDDDDTQSSVLCVESNFCEFVEESTGCDHKTDAQNEDESEITQIQFQVSDEETQDAICRDGSVSQLEENMILHEDDVYQESNDSNEIETSEEESQKPQQNDTKTRKIAKVTEMRNLDIELCNLRRTARNKKPIEEEEEESREFNPQGPNFLPLEPDLEAERVDLKHQMVDERRNSEEWMVDYALRQAVSKIAPARRKKVALLVEAFETVSPIPKYESKLFPPTRSIQACR